MKENLLNKYYKGETSQEEEKELKAKINQEENSSSEQDIFEYFEEKKVIPEDLEEGLFAVIENMEKRNRTLRRRIYSFTSAAAAVIVFLSIYIDTRNTKNAKMENDFFVMEQALVQVSKSIQPDIQEDMLVLWVDDNVEIIIN